MLYYSLPYLRVYCTRRKILPQFVSSSRVVQTMGRRVEESLKRVYFDPKRFEKGYMANSSEELFTIREVHASDPPVYRLVDDLGEVLDGTFYEPELQKVLVSKDKLYRVESVLQRQSNRRFALLMRTRSSTLNFGTPLPS